MIAYIQFEVGFHNVPIHSAEQLQAFEDRLKEHCLALHPTREANRDVVAALSRYTPIHPEIITEASAPSHAKA